MPIVVRPTADEPLTQGDILRDVPLVFTAADGSSTLIRDAEYVLVVSRRCGAFRTDLVTVAPVVPHAVNLAEFRNKLEGDGKSKAKAKPGEVLDGLRRFLSGIRDGGQYFDAFYLGNLSEGEQKRFAAQLQTLFTIEVPADDDARRDYLTRHRVWRLSEEFIHDLHSRLFTTYARLGFDDHAWFSDPDLEVMINYGEAEINKRRVEVTDVQKVIQEKEANHDVVKPPLREQLALREKELRQEEKALEPYLAERGRRGR